MWRDNFQWEEVKRRDCLFKKQVVCQCLNAQLGLPHGVLVDEEMNRAVFKALHIFFNEIIPDNSDTGINLVYDRCNQIRFGGCDKNPARESVGDDLGYLIPEGIGVGSI